MQMDSIIRSQPNPEQLLRLLSPEQLLSFRFFENRESFASEGPGSEIRSTFSAAQDHINLVRRTRMVAGQSMPYVTPDLKKDFSLRPLVERNF